MRCTNVMNRNAAGMWMPARCLPDIASKVLSSAVSSKRKTRAESQIHRENRYWRGMIGIILTRISKQEHLLAFSLDSLVLSWDIHRTFAAWSKCFTLALRYKLCSKHARKSNRVCGEARVGAHGKGKRSHLLRKLPSMVHSDPESLMVHFRHYFAWLIQAKVRCRECCGLFLWFLIPLEEPDQDPEL